MTTYIEIVCKSVKRLFCIVSDRNHKPDGLKSEPFHRLKTFPARINWISMNDSSSIDYEQSLIFDFIESSSYSKMDTLDENCFPYPKNLFYLVFFLFSCTRKQKFIFYMRFFSHLNDFEENFRFHQWFVHKSFLFYLRLFPSFEFECSWPMLVVVFVQYSLLFVYRVDLHPRYLFVVHLIHTLNWLKEKNWFESFLPSSIIICFLRFSSQKSSK